MKKSEKEHLSKLADLGCIVCFLNGYEGTRAEIHHIRKGQGMGQRSKHEKAIPLCHAHHRTGGYGIALHAGQAAFEKKYGSEEYLLEQTLERI